MENIMKKRLASIGIAIATLSLSHSAFADDFKLNSPEIKANQSIPQRFEFNGFGCKGENKSPELRWSGAPKGTKSYAITMYDPDAPTGSGWWHWMIVNIPASTQHLPSDAGAENSKLIPPGALTIRSDFGTLAWGGVCPPPGDKPHRYTFTVHALSVDKLELPANASPALAGYMINANRLATASFTATYGRTK
jgi:Raf kinase inhibitor-like YbhB/YbcL family protein